MPVAQIAALERRFQSLFCRPEAKAEPSDRVSSTFSVALNDALLQGSVRVLYASGECFFVAASKTTQVSQLKELIARQENLAVRDQLLQTPKGVNLQVLFCVFLVVCSLSFQQDNLLLANYDIDAGDTVLLFVDTKAELPATKLSYTFDVSAGWSKAPVEFLSVACFPFLAGGYPCGVIDCHQKNGEDQGAQFALGVPDVKAERSHDSVQLDTARLQQLSITRLVFVIYSGADRRICDYPRPSVRVFFTGDGTKDLADYSARIESKDELKLAQAVIVCSLTRGTRQKPAASPSGWDLVDILQPCSVRWASSTARPQSGSVAGRGKATLNVMKVDYTPVLEAISKLKL